VLNGGSAGNDILVGGAGNDQLTAGSGRSLLFGGSGADTLTGGGDDDLLIAGTTSYDTNTAALLALLSEWKRTDADYAIRISNLRNGGGNNGSFKLTSGTVHNDASADVLTGGAGQDWFWASLAEITDRDPSEQVN
jgi:Ca2+-binding RTX toxin-like protein